MIHDFSRGEQACRATIAFRMHMAQIDSRVKTLAKLKTRHNFPTRAGRLREATRRTAQIIARRRALAVWKTDDRADAVARAALGSHSTAPLPKVAVELREAKRTFWQGVWDAVFRRGEYG